MSSEVSLGASGRTRRRNVFAAFLTTLAFLIGGAVVNATPAAAYSATVTAWRSSGANDTYRASAYATSISGAQIRARLIRNWGPDYTSSWTARTYTTVSTGYFTCWQGCSAGHDTRAA